MISSNMPLIFNIWILIFSSIVTFENHPKCGQMGKNSKLKASQFIVGGEDAKIEEYPFMASLRKGGHICGATILNKRWILTAAHCVDEGIPSDFSIRIGTTDNSDGKHSHKIQMIVIHGCFSVNTLKDDIALLKTTTEMIEIDFDGINVRTICLPEPLSEPSNRKLFHTGWGVFEKYGEKTSDVLQMAETELFGEKYCTSMSEFTNIGLVSIEETGTMLCVHSLNNQGDSGGPLFEVIDGIAVQMGIASYISGFAMWYWFGYRCSGSELVMYTKVSSYIDWIDAAINNFTDFNEKSIWKNRCDVKPFQFVQRNNNID